MTKVCNKCRLEQSKSNFSKNIGCNQFCCFPLANEDALECSGWLPIPVATTDVKSNVPWHHMGEPTEAPDNVCWDAKLLTRWDAIAEIAKRDDLIRRMAYALNGCYLTDYIDDTAFDLMAEVNELMGVK